MKVTITATINQAFQVDPTRRKGLFKRYIELKGEDGYIYPITVTEMAKNRYAFLKKAERITATLELQNIPQYKGEGKKYVAWVIDNIEVLEWKKGLTQAEINKAFNTPVYVGNMFLNK